MKTTTETMGPLTTTETFIAQKRATEIGAAFAGWELFPFRVAGRRWSNYGAGQVSDCVCFETEEAAVNFARAMWAQEKRTYIRVTVDTPNNPTNYRVGGFRTLLTLKRAPKKKAA